MFLDVSGFFSLKTIKTQLKTKLTIYSPLRGTAAAAKGDGEGGEEGERGRRGDDFESEHKYVVCFFRFFSIKTIITQLKTIYFS